MKYKRLTKEQFEALHLEFANFLATDLIDRMNGTNLKLKNLTLQNKS